MESWRVFERCEVRSLQDARATVRFVGRTQFAPGDWVGVELHDVLGKNDGSVDGVQYFELDKVHGNYGLFCRPNNLRKVSLQSSPIETRGTREKQLNVIRLLEDKIIKLKAETTKLNDNLNEQKLQYQQQLDTLTEMVEQLTLDSTNLQDDYDKLNAEYSKILNMNRLLSSENGSLQEELNLRNEMDKFIDPSDDLTDPKTLSQRNRYLENVILQLQTVIDDSLKEHEDVILESKQLSTENDKYLAELTQLKSELQSNKDIVVDLNNKLEAQENFEQVVNYLTEKNRSLTVELNQLRNTIDLNNESVASLEQLEKKLAENEDALSIKQQEIQNLTTQLDDLQNVILPERDKQLKKLNAEISELAHEFSNNKVYYQFTQYYIDQATDDWTTIKIQLKYLTILINQNDKLLFLEKQILLIKLQIFEDIGSFFFEANDDGTLDEQYSRVFIRKFWTFRDWKFKLMENHIVDADLQMNDIVSFLEKELEFDFSLVLKILHNILSGNFIIILNHLKDLEDSDIELISGIYEQVLNMIRVIEKLFHMLNSSKGFDISGLKRFFDVLNHFTEVDLNVTKQICDETLSVLTHLERSCSEKVIPIEREPTKVEESFSEENNEPIENNLQPTQDLIDELTLKLKISEQKIAQVDVLNDWNIKLKRDMKELTNALTEKDNLIEQVKQEKIQLQENLQVAKINTYHMGQIDHIFSNVHIIKTESMYWDDIHDRYDLKQIIKKLHKQTSDSTFEWLMNDYETTQSNKDSQGRTNHDDIYVPLQTSRIFNLVNEALNCIDSCTHLQRKSNTITNVIDEITTYL